MEFIKLPESQIPIYTRSQVVVCGGGSAGFSAAVCAARAGAKTILIEQGNRLGGNATRSLVSILSGIGPQVNQGFFREFSQKLKDCGYLIEAFNAPSDPEIIKSLSFDYVEKEGVELLLHTTVVDVLRERNRVTGVVISNKSGFQAIMGEVFIDTTGDADVAALAGEAFEKMKLGENAMTLTFRIGGIDTQRYVAFAKDPPDEVQVNTGGKFHDAAIFEPDRDKPVIVSGVSGGLVKRAREKGELHLGHNGIGIGFLPAEGTALINAVRISNRDPVNGKDLTLAETEGTKQMMSVFSFLKKNVPGFENSFLMDSASLIGIRESRRVIGEYVMKEQDVREGRYFDDAVASTFHPIDIHGPGEGQTYTKLKAAYQIPYRSLLAKVNENLLVAGRCFSVDRVAHGATRTIPICFGMGQATGVAAALSVQEKKSPKEINIGRLQSELEKQGVVIAKKAS